MSDEFFKNNTEFVIVFHVPGTKLDRAIFTEEFSTHYYSHLLLPIVITNCYYYVYKSCFS